MINKRIEYFRFTAALFLLIGGISSCTKNFETINAPTNGSPVATVSQLYVGFVSNMAQGDQQVGYNSWVYPITELAPVYTKADYSYGNDGNEYWSNFYHNLSNYEAMMQAIARQPDTTVYTNIKAQMKVLRGYMAIKLTNLFGDMPYSAAGKSLDYTLTNDTVLTPAYDSQKSIYLSVLSDLQWAVDNFSTSSSQVAVSNDLVLENNIQEWIEFANSLRLRIALTMYAKDPADATPQITDALTKPLLDADNTNVGLYPTTNIPNMDLSARMYSFGTECRLRMGTAMWNLMSSDTSEDGSGIFDPRCAIFFEPNNNNQWNPFPQNPTASTPAEEGSPYDEAIRNSDWANKDGNPPTPNLYANLNYYWAVDNNIPELFMTAAEVHFLKAEIYAAGLAGVAQNMATAQTEYNAGITASVNFWTQQAINSTVWVVNKPSGLPSPAAMNALLTNPVVLFNPATALQQIYAQEWIDMFRQPWDAWTLQKRTGGMTPTDPNNASFHTNSYGSFQRYQYPPSEQTYNKDNWLAETGGNDLTATKIWIAQ
ncbi:MAG TPA: SusD/RagB family nutrient-binding outer membrane lipoprotein [Puia sp.]|nr:SusD/RagB family nutrient-binding outer membrane lipoprotein [Puia sp.]